MPATGELARDLAFHEEAQARACVAAAASHARFALAVAHQLIRRAGVVSLPATPTVTSPNTSMPPGRTTMRPV